MNKNSTSKLVKYLDLIIVVVVGMILFAVAGPKSGSPHGILRDQGRSIADLKAKYGASPETTVAEASYLEKTSNLRRIGQKMRDMNYATGTACFWKKDSGTIMAIFVGSPAAEVCIYSQYRPDGVLD